jgi:tRNA(fMet)-specific endonuclease VapC
VKFLLDTSTCIDLLQSREKVVSRMGAQSPDDCGISRVTAYELFCGVLKCRDPKDERAKVDLLLRTIHPIEFDESSAWVSAQIRQDLESRGLRIGPYDVLLAGQAVSHDLTLVTSNTGEFSRIAALRLENWRTGK